MKNWIVLIFLVLFAVVALATPTYYFLPYSMWPQGTGIVPRTVTHNCGALCATFAGGCDVSTTNWDKVNRVLVCPSPTPVPSPSP
jgi:hypothetical protein